MLRDRIMLGIIDDDTRNDRLKMRNLLLKKCIDICRAAEHAKLTHKAMKTETPLVLLYSCEESTQI